MFSGDVNMWRSIVTGRIDEEDDERQHVGDPQRLVPVLQDVRGEPVDESSRADTR